jgi:SAM-dependent methyltransferase
MPILDRLSAGPLDLLKRLVYKKVIGPIRYGAPSGYDAERYWRDRLQRHGSSLRGPGDEGLSEEENQRRYQLAARALAECERMAGIDVATARILDIGCGTGFYAQFHYDVGARTYTGIDLTDVLFGQLRERFSTYRFLQLDVTRDAIPGKFDLVLMIDVAEHIIAEEAMDGAVENVRRALSPGGVFFVGPVMRRAKHHLFYVRFWSEDEMRSRFLDHEEVSAVPFRGGVLLGFRRRRDC